MTSLPLDRVLEFMRLMLKLQEVLRANGVPGCEYKENDVEHSYQLAMMAWYLNEAADLGFEVEQLLRYALVHDLAEAYAGDVPSLDYAEMAAKVERERKAIERIAAELPEFPELISWVERYEARADKAAIFIYALDKLMPMLLIYLEDGRTWHELGWSQSELLANKDKTTLGDPLVHEVWQELRVRLEERVEWFPKP